MAIRPFFGDVRKAKALMLSSLRHAEERRASKVEVVDVEASIGDVRRISLAEILRGFQKAELIALASLVSAQKDVWALARQGQPEPPTTGFVHKMFRKNIEKNEGSLVDAVMMKNYFQRLEMAELVWHKTGHNPSRGRVNFYYLSEDYDVEDYYKALVSNGINPWVFPSVEEAFR